MCGRFTQRDSQLPGLHDVLGNGGEVDVVRYNGAPSQDFWVIRRHPETGAYHRDRLVWGLIPAWCKDANGGRKPINARSETAASLPTFRGAFAKRRCLVPADSFFEWRRAPSPKQPYAIARKDAARFAFAGLWENWKHPETGDHVRTFCILTRPAEGMIATIHDRMPVIVQPDFYKRWLSDTAGVTDIIDPDHGGDLILWPVSPAVNSAKNDNVSLLDEIEPSFQDPTEISASTVKIGQNALDHRITVSEQTSLFD